MIHNKKLILKFIITMFRKAVARLWKHQLKQLGGKSYCDNYIDSAVHVYNFIAVN